MIKIVALLIALAIPANASGIIIVKKKAAPAGGGGTPDGTVLVGDDTIYTFSALAPGAQNDGIYGPPFTAVASGTPNECYFYGSMTDAASGDCWIALYDASESLMCQSALFNCSEADTTQGPHAMSGCADIVLGQDYTIVLGGGYYRNVFWSSDSGTWDLHYETGANATTAAASISEASPDGGDDSFQAPWSIWCTQ